MASARITIQDIADELGLSRNTVSKALNNTGVLADNTKDKIIQKAMEMGYHRFSYIAQETMTAAKPVNREIALFTSSIPSNSHFASTMLDYFQNEISSLGYRLSLYLIREQELRSLTLPMGFNKENTDGILIIELFDLSYSQFICSLDIPALFVDSTVNPREHQLDADFLYMDNATNIFLLMKELIGQQKTKFGFIGEVNHCHSFYERYQAFRHSLDSLGAAFHPEWCILENNNTGTYQDYLKTNFNKMTAMPEVFFCANDFVAIDFLKILEQTEYSVPNSFYLCGFDDSPESKVITPSLTTIHIHSQVMGLSAIQLLISRIKDPEIHYRTMHTETTLKRRLSTNDQ